MIACLVRFGSVLDPPAAPLSAFTTDGTSLLLGCGWCAPHSLILSGGYKLFLVVPNKVELPPVLMGSEQCEPKQENHKMGNTNGARRFFWSICNISFVVGSIGLMITGCTNRPVTKTTTGENIVSSDLETKVAITSADKPKVGPKTWESVPRITKISEKPIGVKPSTKSTSVPTKKTSKNRLWETGSAGGFKGALGSAAPTKSAGSHARASTMLHKSLSGASVPSFESSAGSISADSLSSSSVRSMGEFKERRPAFKPKKAEIYQNQTNDNLLTAGSFDDADDIQVFQSFWDSSELARSSQLNGSRMSNWAKAYKKADTYRHGTLQLAFVVDTTGSMGDELEYLKVEFKSIVAEIDRSYPGVKKEYAFIAYRDQSDEYVTRGLNFTTDVEEVQTFIRNQSAGGGGDYPEAVHTAFEEAYSRLNWNSSSDSARMLFHIADAPAHMEDMDSTFASVEKLIAAGVNVFPVAASGVQDVAEAMMRATALLSGGQYIFLTDDSGVGNAHAAPKHPCYDVEKLKNVMTRVIKDRISGSRTFPIAKNVIRHGGDRNAGCRQVRPKS